MLFIPFKVFSGLSYFFEKSYQNGITYFSIKKRTFYDKSSVFKIIGDAFRTDCVCSLSSHFTYWKLKSKMYSFSLDLKSYEIQLKNVSSQSAANNVIRTHSNGYRGTTRMFSFFDGLSLIIRRLSFSSKKYVLLSWHKALELSKVDE